jgi:hypothetical protein
MESKSSGQIVIPVVCNYVIVFEVLNHKFIPTFLKQKTKGEMIIIMNIMGG